MNRIKRGEFHQMRFFDVFLAISFVLIITYSDLVFAQEERGLEGPQKSVNSRSEQAKDLVDCRKVRTTSSRIKRKICLKESQWKRIEESSQLLSREMYSS